MSVKAPWLFVSDHVHEANCLVAIKARPSSTALATLPLCSVVFLKAVCKVLDARGCLILVGVSCGIKELVSPFICATICRVESIL